MTSFQIEEITSTSGLERIEPEWWELHSRCPDATPFHSPAWLITWWKHFGFGELWTLAVREQNSLIAVAPLFIHPISSEARLSSSDERHPCQLSPIGIGITDYTDFLFQPEHAEAACEAILNYFAESEDAWDAADLSGLRESNPLLTARMPQSIEIRKIPGQVCPFLPLPDSPEKFVAQLSPNRRHSYRNGLRKLKQAGAHFEDASAESCREKLEALFQLHQAHWRERGGSSVFAEPKARDFHLETAEAFARRGWLRLTALRIEEEIAGVLYGFSCNARLCLYQSGFDPALESLSPGTALTGYAIEQAVREGIKEVDFLRGGEEYKYTWGARDRQSYRLLLRSHEPRHGFNHAESSADRVERL